MGSFLKLFEMPLSNKSKKVATAIPSQKSALEYLSVQQVVFEMKCDLQLAKLEGIKEKEEIPQENEEESMEVEDDAEELDSRINTDKLK